MGLPLADPAWFRAAWAAVMKHNRTLDLRPLSETTTMAQTAEQLVEQIKAAHAAKGGKVQAINWQGLLDKIKAIAAAAPQVLAVLEEVLALLNTPQPAPTPVPGPAPAQS